jgi:hypothetical protein
MNSSRGRGQRVRALQLDMRPLSAQQLEFLDPLLAQNLNRGGNPAAAEHHRPPGIAPDEVSGQLNPGL